MLHCALCNVSIESYAATVHNTQCNALTGVKSWATCGEGGAKTRRLPLFTAFHRWEVFPPNSASNGAACSSSVTFARNYSENTSQCLDLRNTLRQVTKRDSFRQLAMLLGYTILAAFGHLLSVRHCPSSKMRPMSWFLWMTNCKFWPWRNSL